MAKKTENSDELVEAAKAFGKTAAEVTALMTEAAKKAGKNDPLHDFLKKLAGSFAAVEAAAKKLKPGDADESKTAKAVKELDAPLRKISEMEKKLARLANDMKKEEQRLANKIAVLFKRTDELRKLVEEFDK